MHSKVSFNFGKRTANLVRISLITIAENSIKLNTSVIFSEKREKNTNSSEATTCLILHTGPANACTYANICGLKNFSAAMLATQRSAGVTPGMNVSSPLHTGDKV